MSLSKLEEEELLGKIYSALTDLYRADAKAYANAEIRQELAKQGCVVTQHQLGQFLDRLEVRGKVEKKEGKRHLVYTPITEGEPMPGNKKGDEGSEGTGVDKADVPPELRNRVYRVLRLSAVFRALGKIEEAKAAGCDIYFSKVDLVKEGKEDVSRLDARLETWEKALNNAGLREQFSEAEHLYEVIRYVFRFQKGRDALLEKCLTDDGVKLVRERKVSDWMKQPPQLVKNLGDWLQGVADKCEPKGKPHQEEPPLPAGLLAFGEEGVPPARKPEAQPSEPEKKKELAEAILKFLLDYSSNSELPQWARDVAVAAEEDRMDQLMNHTQKELEDLNQLLTDFDTDAASSETGAEGGSPPGGEPPPAPGAGGTSHQNSQEAARLREQVTQAGKKYGLLEQELEKLSLSQKELTEAWEVLKPGCGLLTPASLKDALENVVSGQVHMREIREKETELTNAKAEVTRLNSLLRDSVQKGVHETAIAAKNTEIEALKKAQTAPVSRWWKWGWKPTTAAAMIAAVAIASIVYVNNLPDASPARKPAVSTGKKGITRAEFQRRLTQMEKTRQQSPKTSK